MSAIDKIIPVSIALEKKSHSTVPRVLFCRACWFQDMWMLFFASTIDKIIPVSVALKKKSLILPCPGFYSLGLVYNMDHRIKIFVILLGCRGFEPMTLLTSTIQIGKDPGEDSCFIVDSEKNQLMRLILIYGNLLPFLFWRFKSGGIGKSVGICQSFVR